MVLVRWFVTVKVVVGSPGKPVKLTRDWSSVVVTAGGVIVMILVLKTVTSEVTLSKGTGEIVSSTVRVTNELYVEAGDLPPSQLVVPS